MLTSSTNKLSEQILDSLHKIIHITNEDNKHVTQSASEEGKDVDLTDMLQYITPNIDA